MTDFSLTVGTCLSCFEVCLISIFQNITEREREGSWELKIVTPGKIVPHIVPAPLAWILAWIRILTQTFFWTYITHFQLLSVMFTEYGQNANTHDISWIKLFWEKRAEFCELWGQCCWRTMSWSNTGTVFQRLKHIGSAVPCSVMAKQPTLSFSMTNHHAGSW